MQTMSYLRGWTLKVNKNSWVGTFQNVEVEEYWLLPATRHIDRASLYWSITV